jgi:hypothetical protein
MNMTDKITSNSRAYYVTFRDRSDQNPMAIFFIAYAKDDDAVIFESATYYNETELDRAAMNIITARKNFLEARENETHQRVQELKAAIKADRKNHREPFAMVAGEGAPQYTFALETSAEPVQLALL